MKISQNRFNASVLYLRSKQRLSMNHIAEVLYLNVKTVWEKIERAKRHGTIKGCDNRRLPMRVKQHLVRTFKLSKGYYMRIWDFIYGLYDTIEEAMKGKVNEEEPSEEEPP